jgi:hypothetical protein
MQVMSSCAFERVDGLELIGPQAHARCLVFEPPREPLPEWVEWAYEAARLALIEQHLVHKE